MGKLFYLLAFTAFFGGCKKNTAGSDSSIEFYLLDSYTQVSGKCQVAPASAILKPTPFISNEDIIAYSEFAYTYTLSAAAMQRIKAFVGRQPFAITINKGVVFYGFYNSSFLSSSCDHSISLDADSGSSDNKILLQLGYPSLISGVTIDDQRNNTALINVLKAQGKWRL